MSSRVSLVIGGGGFLGRHLVHALLMRGDIVRVLSRNPLREVNSNIVEKLELFVGDYGDDEVSSRCLEGVQHVFHLASTTQPKSSNDDVQFDIESNLVASTKLFDQLVAKPDTRVIFVSSGGTVYGVPTSIPIAEEHPRRPICSYGVVKSAIENYLHMYETLHGMAYRTLRVSNPFGPTQHLNSAQGAIGNFLHRLSRGEKLQVWGDGSVVRDYIYVTDVIESLLLASVHEGPERVFNIGSGTGHKLTEVIELIAKALGKRPEIEYTPSRAFDIPVNVLDIESARRHLGWNPTVALEAGIEKLADLYRT